MRDELGNREKKSLKIVYSCTHSFASFAIFAVDGTEDFMIRETLAIWSLMFTKNFSLSFSYNLQVNIYPVPCILPLPVPLLVLGPQ